MTPGAKTPAAPSGGSNAMVKYSCENWTRKRLFSSFLSTESAADAAQFVPSTFASTATASCSDE